MLQFGQLYPLISVRQPLQQCWLGYKSIATELGHLRSFPVSAPQIQHNFEEKKEKNRLKAVSEVLKNILGSKYYVNCSQTKIYAKQPEGSHGLVVSQDCIKRKKVGRRGEMSEQIGNYPVDLTA